MRWALSLAVFVLAACTNNVGPTGPVIGGPCFDDYDCAAGSYCLTSFREGTCTTNCTQPDHCRSGSTCVEGGREGGGVCLLTCAEDGDCGRAGYLCAARNVRDDLSPASGTTMVCVSP